jgi:hypothetical protein
MQGALIGLVTLVDNLLHLQLVLTVRKQHLPTAFDHQMSCQHAIRENLLSTQHLA